MLAIYYKGGCGYYAHYLDGVEDRPSVFRECAIQGQQRGSVISVHDIAYSRNSWATVLVYYNNRLCRALTK